MNTSQRTKRGDTKVRTAPAVYAVPAISVLSAGALAIVCTSTVMAYKDLPSSQISAFAVSGGLITGLLLLLTNLWYAGETASGRASGAGAASFASLCFFATCLLLYGTSLTVSSLHDAAPFEKQIQAQIATHRPEIQSAASAPGTVNADSAATEARRNARTLGFMLPVSSFTAPPKPAGQ